MGSNIPLFPDARRCSRRSIFAELALDQRNELLQRIRDEAHRWANGYHQLLLNRRVAESILDECPGVSQNRKTALLKHFGSVARMRKASPEQIAKVPGIGAGLAKEVFDFLLSRA